MSAGRRPTGVVTFLFTDVAGSTALWAADPDGMSSSLEQHDAVLREVFSSAGGYVFTTAGDSFSVAFQEATAAVGAATAAQRQLSELDWSGPHLEVRIGLHASTAVERDGDYFGPGVNTAARIEAVGHPGQVLLSDAVASAVDAVTVDLGVYRLRGLPDAVRIHQLGDRSHPPLRVPVGETVRLPAAPTPIVGRHDDVGGIRRRLRERRVVTLTGVGGTGKTRLAIEVAEREIPHYPDGVWFVDLAAVEDPDDLDGHVARSIGVTVGDDENPSERVVRQMVSRRALLVLDNCEHVIDAAADLIEAILSERSESRILATSREALDIDGEAVVQVPSMSVETDDGSVAPAVRLFIERAHDAGLEVDTDLDTRRSIAELCGRLDGIPLAIELAAARTASMTPALLLERLDERFALLGRRRRGHGRQRTLESTIDWSYRLLDADEQRVFRWCGVFTGGFDLDAAAGVVGLSTQRTFDVLDSLVAKSLINTTRRKLSSPVIESTSYRMLETLRAYAQDKLVDLDEAMMVQDAHAAFFAARYDPLDTRWTSSFLRGVDEHDSLITAFEHAMARGDVELAQRLLAGVCGNAARWPPLPTAARFMDHPLADPTTTYGRNAVRAVAHDALENGNLATVSAAIDRLCEAGEHAAISAHVLEVFAHGRRNRAASQEALARADDADLTVLPPVEASWIRLYRAYGHWLHGDTDWMRREISDDQGSWVRLTNPIALSIPGVIDVLEGRTLTYHPVDEARRARSFLLTFDHALSRNRDALRDDLIGARAHLEHDPTSGSAFPIFCSHAVLTWALDDHDLTRRMLIAAGAPATPYSCIVHHLGRLLGCEDDMLQRQPDTALIRNIGNVVLDHIDEVQALVDHAR